MSYLNLIKEIAMEKDRKLQIKEIFGQALEKEAETRDHFLTTACANDQSMLTELLSLLKSHEEAGDFLEKPMANLAAQLLKEEKANPYQNNELILTKLVGCLLDEKYQIEKQLGEGGMGAVYQATHLGTKRPVAIKVISPKFMQHAEFVERFKREAAAAGRLHHPNVVNVTDFGVANLGKTRLAYLVMEYLDGCTLGNLLKKKGRLPISFTVDIMEQVCLAVAEAHNTGIIHRDLKPDNIWLQPDGRGGFNVKVLDFGLAKLSTPRAKSDSPRSVVPIVTSVQQDSLAPTLAPDSQVTSSPNLETKALDSGVTQAMETRDTGSNIDPKTVPQWLTRVGIVLGTPLYMSPEQCHGEKLDLRSDIYSMGVIAYEMLTGETPFKGDLHQLIDRHTHQPPINIREKRREVPKPIANTIMSALAKSSAHRPVSAKAFAVALRTNLNGEAVLIKDSLAVFQSNLMKFFSLSALINLPILFVNLFLLTKLITTEHNYPFAAIIQIFWWLTPLVLFMFAGELTTAIYALAIKGSFDKQDKTNNVTLLLTLLKRLPSLTFTVLQSYLVSLTQLWKFFLPTFKAHVNYSLCAPITILEDMKGTQAMNRSKTLLGQFYSLAYSLKLRSLLLRTLTFCLTLIVLCLSGVINGSITASPSLSIINVAFFALFLPGLFVIFASPALDIALASLYFKAREAQGESFQEIKYTIEEVELKERAKLTIRRKVFIAASLVVALLFSSASYLLVVPPSGTIPQISKPVITKLPDSQNAWQEYDLAIKDVLELDVQPISFSKPDVEKTLSELINNRNHEFANNPVRKDLEQVAYGNKEFTDLQLAYLAQHQGMIKHLLAGAKRPAAQYYSETPDMNSPVPNLLQIRGVLMIAAAEARRLQLAGKPQEAAEVALAGYRFAIDAGDENGTLISALISVVGQGIMAGNLHNQLISNQTTAEIDLQIARELAAMYHKQPTPNRVLSNELLATKLYLEKKLVYNQLSPQELNHDALINPFKVITHLPGLKLRVFKTFVEICDQTEQEQATLVGNWDFQGLAQLNNKYKQQEGTIPSVEELTRQIAGIFRVNAAASLRSYYNVHVINLALQSYAVCNAYNKHHGQFPATLEMAFHEAGLDMVIDPVTKKAVNYQLENGKPVIWFAGVDGVDNGGKVAYKAIERGNAVPGSDIIFHYGQTPIYFEPSKN